MSTYRLSGYLVWHQHLQELVVTWSRFDMEPFIQYIVMPELRFLVVNNSDFPWDSMSAPLLGVMETNDEWDSARDFLSSSIDPSSTISNLNRYN
jgi:hypothetical protein